MGLVADSQGAKASAAATNWEEPPSAGEKCGHGAQKADVSVEPSYSRSQGGWCPGYQKKGIRRCGFCSVITP
jgi:hypothetical protein